MLSGRLTIFRVRFLECPSLSQRIGHAQTGHAQTATLKRASL